MRKTIKGALVAAALIGGSLVAGLPAMADNLSVAVSPGGIAFGYNDGYWDQGHAWHAWKNAEESAQFQAANRDHYYAYKHDRDSDKGWRANDTWWSHH
jgi:hypothetical protein